MSELHDDARLVLDRADILERAGNPKGSGIVRRFVGGSTARITDLSNRPARTDNKVAIPAIGRLLRRLNDDRPPFHRFAACRSVVADVFIPTTNAGRAVAFSYYCGGCEVRDTCLKWAIEVRDFTAILGGSDGPDLPRIAKTRSTGQALNYSFGRPI